MDQDNDQKRLRRRSLVLRLSLAAPALGLTACVPQQPGYYPNTGYYPPPRRQVTDSDPRDGVGQGRGWAPPRRQITDSDPRDAPGRGRGW